jgi:hypothetical protein
MIVLKRTDQVDMCVWKMLPDIIRFFPSKAIRKVIIQKDNIGIYCLEILHALFECMKYMHFKIAPYKIIFHQQTKICFVIDNEHSFTKIIMVIHQATCKEITIRVLK